MRNDNRCRTAGRVLETNAILAPVALYSIANCAHETPQERQMRGALIILPCLRRQTPARYFGISVYRTFLICRPLLIRAQQPLARSLPEAVFTQSKPLHDAPLELRKRRHHRVAVPIARLRFARANAKVAAGPARHDRPTALHVARRAWQHAQLVDGQQINVQAVREHWDGVDGA